MHIASEPAASSTVESQPRSAPSQALGCRKQLHCLANNVLTVRQASFA